MRVADIIRRKQHGGELTRDEIADIISGLMKDTIPEYQISALLMAVYFAGMSEQETLALTEEMLRSGTVLDLSDIAGKKVDKHSTGGVGDKTSLIVTPLAAAAGLRVPMISGRGLGHTGGTLDKLESISGFNVGLDTKQFRTVLEKAGCVINGQTKDIAPADRKLYRLRDVTATVDSVPLIIASILSKKLAEGIDGLVLDVKVGTGAFMKEEASALELAGSLVSTARRLGTPAVALITDMNQPLGTHVGNALEVKESVEVLRGGGPEDLRRLCLQLTAHMLLLGEEAASIDEGVQEAARLLDNGAGLEKLIEIVRLQGGDPRVLENTARLPQAAHRREIRSTRAGNVYGIDTEALGTAAMSLGAGRETVDDSVDPAVGLVVHHKIGDQVESGEPLVTLHYNRASRLREAELLASGAYEISDRIPAPQPLIRVVLGAEG